MNLAAISRHQGFEFLVPAILLGIEPGLAVDDPAHVADAVVPEHEQRRAVVAAAGEDAPHLGEGLGQAAELSIVQAFDHGADLVLRGLVDLAKRGHAGGGEVERGLAPVLFPGRPLQQFLFLKPREDAAEIAGIEAQRLHEVAGGQAVAMRQLIEHPPFAEGERAFQEMLVEQADDAGVVAVEEADLGDGAVEGFGHGVIPAGGELLTLACKLLPWSTIKAQYADVVIPGPPLQWRNPGPKHTERVRLS